MQNKHVIITGGTGGLGRSVTQLALKRGARITIPYHSPDQAERLKQSLNNKDSDRLNFVFADLRDEQKVSEIFEPQERVDGLIHLVGGFSMGPTTDYSLEDWQQQISLNMTSTFLVCKFALLKMQKTGYGRIVTVASRAALEPDRLMAAYSATKAGVLALTRSIAVETKGTGITANTVLPSVIDTPANRKSMGEKEAHKWVKPASLAEVICFLASEAAADIRGAAIPVYGNI
jgi:NAD(P)-dependent dehydrogenase (short-subunit alcohol dehydrogenase family)